MTPTASPICFPRSLAFQRTVQRAKRPPSRYSVGHETGTSLEAPERPGRFAAEDTIRRSRVVAELGQRTLEATDVRPLISRVKNGPLTKPRARFGCRRLVLVRCRGGGGGFTVAWFVAKSDDCPQSGHNEDCGGDNCGDATAVWNSLRPPRSCSQWDRLLGLRLFLGRRFNPRAVGQPVIAALLAVAVLLDRPTVSNATRAVNNGLTTNGLTTNYS